MQSGNELRSPVISVRFAAVLFIAVSVTPSCTACLAQTTRSPSPAPSPSPSAWPEAPLYNMADQIYSVDRQTTLNYYFQDNRDGTATVKQELRYGRNVSANGNDQIRIRIPIVTKFPAAGNPYSGLGNLELGYSYSNATERFDHSYEIRGAFNTNANNVDSHDSELKGFYTTKWKWKAGALSYANEYDQSIIVPSNAKWTSYYEGKLQLPDMAFSSPLQNVKLSLFWNFRVLFDSGGVMRNAVGATIFGTLNDVAFIVTDTWGVGANGLWKYKLEANASARF